MNRYVIRVEGALSAGLISAFPSLEAADVHAQTVLHGRLECQSALAGVLRQLEDLGVDIAEVHLVHSHETSKSRTTLHGNE